VLIAVAFRRGQEEGRENRVQADRIVQPRNLAMTGLTTIILYDAQIKPYQDDSSQKPDGVSPPTEEFEGHIFRASDWTLVS